MRWAPLALLSFACHDSTPTQSPAPEPIAAPAPTPDPVPPLDPEARFADLETRLLAATSVRITFDITAEGATKAALRGVLELSANGRAELEARGNFAGEPGELHFTSDGRTMKGERGGKRFELPAGKALQESVLLGLTRMGLLHNLSALWGGRPPDLADGGIREWVVAIEHRDASTAERAVLGFDLAVQGTTMGDATLVLDAAGWPAERTQTVHFPNGDMKVVERYEAFEVIAPLAPATTARPP